MYIYRSIQRMDDQRSTAGWMSLAFVDRLMSCIAFNGRLLLTLLDMSKYIPKEVSRLFRVSFTTIFPVHYRETETRFIPHDPFQITDHQSFVIYSSSSARSKTTYSSSDQAIYPPILTLSSLTASTNSFKYSPKYFCLRSSFRCSASGSLDSSSTGNPFSVIQIGILQGLAYRPLM
jgi:hypothetical protein